MPIKLPKTFQRRKSSGNALEEVQNPPQSSFRVIERNPDGSKSFEGGAPWKRTQAPRPLSEGHALEMGQGQQRPNPAQMNRGSGGTQTSTSSGGPDTSSSSARFSSSSTLPSSSSLEQDSTLHAHSKPKLVSSSTLPPPPPAAATGFSLRAGARKFSFGNRKTPIPQVAEAPPLPRPDQEYSDIPDVGKGMRSRAMTEISYTSASTATPPKILDTDLGLSLGERDGFGSLFDSIDGNKRNSRSADVSLTPKPLRASPVAASPHVVDRQSSELFDVPSSYLESTPPPPPLHIDRTRMITPSPYSADSQDSRDALISTPQREEYSRDSPRNGTGLTTVRSGNRAFGASPSPTTAAQDVGPAGRLVHGDTGATTSRVSRHIQDEDAEMFMRFMGSGKSPSAPSASKATPAASAAPPTRRPVTLYDGENQDHKGSGSQPGQPLGLAESPTKAESGLYDDGLGDESFRALATSANRYQSGEKRKAVPPPGKVMTKAQFDAYRKEQARRRAESDASDSDASDDSSADNYDDDEEDEAERNREMAKQRRKQEAQLAVYRQQMMKVTGEQRPPNFQANDASGRASVLGAQSAPDLTLQLPRLSSEKATGNGKAGEDEDEDEDVPLGILAAHGFPSKERPPSHLPRSGSQPNIHYASEAYPPPPASMAGSTAGGRKNVPVFARNLPRDPYYGASIVNPANRESLAFNSGAQSVYGGSQATGPSAVPSNAGVPPHLAAGGLVGVIAKEERARALRRGTTHPAGFSDGAGGSLGANGMPLPPGMMPSEPGMLSPDQQAQLQVSQQMTQMMQMQMQWMQQMMAMQAQGGSPMAMPNMPGMPGMPMMPGAQQSISMPPSPNVGGTLSPPNMAQRPISTGSASAQPQSLGAQGRAMSMLTPGSQPWNRASMAPSRASGARASVFGGQGAAMSFNNSAYAPSITPSERSNLGQPSRYRPLSIAPGADDRMSTIGVGASDNVNNGNNRNTARASTMDASTLKGWDRPASQLSMGNGHARGASKSKMANVVVEEEEEDEGWEEMKKQREGKRRFWKGRKKDTDMESALEGVFYPGD